MEKIGKTNRDKHTNRTTGRNRNTKKNNVKKYSSERDTLDVESMISSRERRRRRRIRSQILAYLTLVVLVVIVISSCFFGVKAIVKHVKAYNDKVSEALLEAESSAELLSEASSENESSDSQTSAFSEVNEFDEMIAELIKDMPLEDKVAGLFMVSPESITGVEAAVKAGDGTRDALAQMPVGGIIYSEKNFKSEEQFKEMLDSTKGYSKYPLFLALYRECGVSTSFGIDETPAASELTDSDSVSQAYSTIGQKLMSYGINMDMAPVADIVSEEGSSELQGRTFGSDAATAAPLANAAVLALQNSEVSAVLQKFPGEAATAKSLEELNNSEFLIYQMAIENGVDCIMVSNKAASGVTGDETPASLSSSMITDTLRGTLGYNGVVITDKLNDSSIAGTYGDEVAAVSAIQAGADIILEPSDYQTAYNAVLQAVKDGKITEDRINESLYRIYRVKYKNALNGAQ